ncbi:MAG TPA: putative metal-dependent hydrolase [Gemmatimonadaceae bacterium]|nr:putative metal-dependent hydrolase [Gemmatimonadaceae bacterium]
MPAPSATPEQDLRYPIGRADAKSPLTPGERAQRIDAIAAAPAQLRQAVAGLSDAQLDTPYRPGGWTIRQLVHHVADSHINAFTRFRLGLTEDNPTIKPYDEKAWAELPDMRHMPVDVSLRLLDALHERLVHLLRATPDSAFARQVRHPDNGPMTIDALVSTYSWHGQHHTAHVTSLREREGWR